MPLIIHNIMFIILFFLFNSLSKSCILQFTCHCYVPLHTHVYITNIYISILLTQQCRYTLAKRGHSERYLSNLVGTLCVWTLNWQWNLSSFCNLYILIHIYVCVCVCMCVCHYIILKQASEITISMCTEKHIQCKIK